MKKLILILLLVMIPLAAAGQGPFKTGENATVVQLCDTCTEINITSIVYPNGTIALSNATMIRSLEQFTYEIDGAYLNESGTYTVYGRGEEGVFSFTFDVTTSGSTIPEGITIIIFVLLSLVMFSGTAIVLLKGFERGVKMEMDLEDWVKSCIAFGVFLLYYWFVWNYWGDVFVINLLEVSLWVVGFMSIFVYGGLLLLSIMKRVRDAA